MLVTKDLNIITLVEGLPKTKLLYWDKQYQKTCDSEIIKIVQEKNEVYIILDKTIFHPKSGGQPTDIGIIKDSKQEISIKKCFITKDVIIHIGKNRDQTVLQNNTSSEINWETRYLYMKRHTTAHLLDHCISKVVKKDVITNDSWLGDECYIGYIGKNITRNEVEEAFKMANDMTEKNLDIFSELTSYEELIKKTLSFEKNKENSIVEGKVISIDKNNVVIDVGLKSEGRIPLSEFTRPGQEPEINIGDLIKVYIDKLDSRYGETKLSREKALKQASLKKLQSSFEKRETVVGIPFSKVKGGLSVDLEGVIAFLPGSQIDSFRVFKDTRELLNKSIDLVILKMDKIMYLLKYIGTLMEVIWKGKTHGDLVVLSEMFLFIQFRKQEFQISMYNQD